MHLPNLWSRRSNYRRTMLVYGAALATLCVTSIVLFATGSPVVEIIWYALMFAVYTIISIVATLVIYAEIYGGDRPSAKRVRGWVAFVFDETPR